jgi:hypothetical protein
VDVTPLMQGPGLLDLVMTEDHRTAIAFASRESGANAPQLVLSTALRKLFPLMAKGG